MSGSAEQTRIVLMADDDPDDRFMAERALMGTPLEGCLRFVEDGVELMDYLERCGRYLRPEDSPVPALILLDLNMPKMDGREVLRTLKRHPRFRVIPVVVLTTSAADEDVVSSYDLGVNAFVTKPVTFTGLRAVLKKVGQFWLEVARHPQLPA